MNDNNPSAQQATRLHRHLAHLDPFTDSPLVFITAATHDRRPILNREAAHACLAEIWGRSADADGWFVGDYLLMPDHVHLFARPAMESKPMATWIQTWKSLSSRVFAKTFALSPPVWQQDYFDRYLRNSEVYSEKWMYVEQNPVRARLVVKAEDWPFKGRIHELRFI